MAEKNRRVDGHVVVAEIPKPENWDAMDAQAQDLAVTKTAWDLMERGVIALLRRETETTILFLDAMQ